ncbi:hypothetical protein B0T21DRAFT_410834 [Apiosordaria backusii]|uniref:Nephrocystin 3-like N-terminal domain-containing protein n=1 Tax=Apiosordaria backusii TaxID=314023 RepID=A0AA40BNG4_9PEZI|nr:hypothetical protein B0T21DRAFT_410834 [Apiosordaria backusii]
MDPASAIGVASSVITFVEVIYKFVSLVYSLGKDGSNTAYDEAEVVWKRMQQSSLEILQGGPDQPNSTTTLSAVDASISDLANECYKISLKIGVKTSRLQPKSRRRRDVFTAAVKDLLSGDEIKQLQRRLDSCCGQLHLYLSIRNRQTLGREIHDEIDRVLIRIQTASEDLAQTAQKYRELSNQRNILSALQFDILDRRFQEVATAADNTYAWIYDGSDHNDSDQDDGENENDNPKNEDKVDNDNGDQDKAEQYHDDSVKDKDRQKRESVHPFKEWLRTGSGIFHVSGKPGAGKSTLMKYLCENQMTQSILQEWAGFGNDLVFGRFFFWREGSALQKSFSGLRRALLYNVLQQCPEVIHNIFPQHWDLSQYQPGIQPPEVMIGDKEISDGLKELLCNVSIYNRRRLIIFIDGLDEFEDDLYSYHNLLNDMLDWVDKSHGCLKLCVSSREFPIFMKRLSVKQRIRLHELNAADILKVIRQGLDGNAEFHALKRRYPDECQLLIEELAKKSEGVFLWVVLTLKTVAESLECHDSLTSIRKKVDLLPQKLQDLFGSILKSIPESQLKDSYCTLSYALIATGITAKRNQSGDIANVDCSLFQLSFLDEYMSGSNELTRCSGNMCEEEIEERIMKAGTQMLARSRNLLTIMFETREGTPYFYFIHRSIPEFLREFLRSDLVARRHLSDGNGQFDALAAYLHTLRNAIEFSSIRLCDNIVLPTVKATHKHLKSFAQDFTTYFNDIDAIHTAILGKYQHEQAKQESNWEGSRSSVYEVCPLYMASDFEITGYIHWKTGKDPHLLKGPESFCLAASILGGRQLPHHTILAERYLEGSVLRRIYASGDRRKPLKRIALIKDLMDRGLDLNYRVSNAETTMWGVVLSSLIQNAHTLMWKLVRFGLEFGLPAPFWECRDVMEDLHLFVGEDRYEIPIRGITLHNRLPRGNCLVRLDGNLVNPRTFLTCDRDNCECPKIEDSDSEDTDSEDSGSEDSSSEDASGSVRTKCWHPYKEDREAILRILDERDAESKLDHRPKDEDIETSDSRHVNQDPPQTTSAISWPWWAPTTSHRISLTSFLIQLRTTAWLSNSALPWVLVALLLLSKLRSSAKGTANIISGFSPLRLWLSLARLLDMRRFRSKVSKG